MIKGIAHNAIKVSNMEKSLNFYCNVAGLEKAFEIHDDDGYPWIVYLKISEGQFIELFYNGEIDPKTNYSSDLIGYHHFCFEVDNIQKMANRINDSGYLKGITPSQGKDFNTNIWIHDPDGNAVEFVQYHPDSPHMKTAE
ncbi:VOC family protein [Bacillus sp. FJAT-49711]|uniref:VOC family protein n=1 Tax=Bacillus sp. FJAT-49711 TaxID=2833585 RepID=UPI001BCA272B|nr:VOC family protein [Bacillus sp. FJAT-49711]MBS4218347.1 VOC family protein [Bacillus sp. FJAT-49711]